MRSTGIVLLAIALGIPPAVTAQAQREFAPYLGSYRPTSIIGIGDGSFPSGGSVRDTVGRLNSTARGIRVTKWGRGRLGFEATVGYAPSSLWSSLAYTAPVYDAHVLTMSLKALLRVTPPPSARGAARGWWGGSRRSWRRRVELRSIVSRSEDVRRWDRERGRRSQASRLAEASVRCRRFRVLCAPWPMHAVGSGLRGVCDVFGEWAARTTGARLQNELVLSVGLALVLHVAERHGSESHK